MTAKTLIGRQFKRTNHGRQPQCDSCGVRLAIGEPRPTDTWTSQLTLTVKERDLLLAAAMEYRELAEACWNCQHPRHVRCRELDCACAHYLPSSDMDPVEFIDWISPDVVAA